MSRWISNSLWISIFLISLQAAAGAAADDAYQINIREIRKDIYLAYRPDVTRPPVEGNTTIIIGETGVVVVDSNGTDLPAERVIAHIRKLTDKPVTHVINTHWHGDHNLGNVVFLRAWPEVKIVAHERTIVNMASPAMDYVKQLVDEDLDELMASRPKGRAQLIERGSDPALVERFDRLTADLPFVVEEFSKTEMVVPNTGFSDRMVISQGNRDIELLFLGRANTDGDAVVYLPTEKIVIAGDIIVHPTPYGFGSYPGEWSDTIQRIRDLDWEVLIPGHGDPLTDDSFLDLLQRLLRAAGARTVAAIEAGLDNSEDARKAVDLSDFQAEISGGDPVLDRLFDVWFWTPILESTYKEATGQEITQWTEPEEETP